MLFRLTTTTAALAATLAISLYCPVASAAFNLTAPAPIPIPFPIPSLNGTMAEAGRAMPCGGADPLDRSSVTEWPVGGLDVRWSSAEAQAGWSVDAVLLNNNNNGTNGGADGTDFADKHNLRTLYTTNTAAGPFCLASVQGVAEWVGREDAVLQVRQWTGNGNYFYAVSS